MDIVEFLKDQNIKVHQAGQKNVSVGWIGIRCPFCNDTTNHCGIELKTLRCNCWRCGGHSLTNLVGEVAECSATEARRIVKSLDQAELSQSHFEKEENWVRLMKFPPVVQPLPKAYKDYLARRGFNPNRIAKKFNLSAATNESKYRFRIIIPMYKNNRLVSFTGRAIYKEMRLKYKHPERREVIYTPKQLVYNYDSFVGGTDLVVCEGPFDVFAWGAGAVATNGIRFSIEQIKILRSKPIRNLFIFFDNESKAQAAARLLLRMLAPYPQSIERVIPKDKKDPGEMSMTEIMEVKQMLSFNEGL